MNFLIDILSNPLFLIIWFVSMLLSEAILIFDFSKHNKQIVGLMKWVWIMTVVYSGVFGLVIYYYSGRKQISRDSILRRGFRSVAHCYSGCGAGEIAGVFIAAGLLSLSNWYIAILSFVLAYVAGFAMTAGPLIQEGVATAQAIKDAFYSETASITVMEVTAIGTDLMLAQNASMSDTLFWSSLIFSLTVGLAAAYPVNILLIHLGVKKGMHNPKNAHSHH